VEKVWRDLQRSDEEIEGEEKQAEDEKKATPGKTALGKLGNRMEEAGRNHKKTRFAARFVEGASGGVAGKIAAEERDFIFHPEG